MEHPAHLDGESGCSPGEYEQIARANSTRKWTKQHHEGSPPRAGSNRKGFKECGIDEDLVPTFLDAFSSSVLLIFITGWLLISARQFAEILVHNIGRDYYGDRRDGEKVCSEVEAALRAKSILPP